MFLCSISKYLFLRRGARNALTASSTVAGWAEVEVPENA
jgi:hypothetical protein